MNVTGLEFLAYVPLFAAVLSGTVTIVLSLGARQLPGRNWLVASAAIGLLTTPLFRLIPLVTHSMQITPREISSWFNVVSCIGLFGGACFGIFLLLNWAGPRMSLDGGNLLFGFSGRIPRSVFWAVEGVLWPVGTMIGVFLGNPLEEQGDVSAPRVLIFLIGGLWCVVSVWISLAVWTKRLHDASTSAWKALVILIPCVGPIWLLYLLGVTEGTRGPNQYGADPLTP